MSQIYCEDEACQEDWDESKPVCLLGDEPVFGSCPNCLRQKEDAGTESDIDSKQTKNDCLTIPWSSNVLGQRDLSLLSRVRHPFIIGVVGEYNAGKTTFLGALYLLLRQGKSIGDFAFGGSYTLLGWERIATFLKLSNRKKLSFPPHTSSNMARVPGLLHLRLINKYGHYQDVLFTDAPGEWFREWAKVANSETSKGARWIDASSDAFLLMADSKAFIDNVGSTRRSLLSIVNRMSNTHQMRPTALIWTKADEDIKPKIKEGITHKVITKLPNAVNYDVSVINHKNDKYTDNILLSINQLLLDWQGQKNELSPIEVKKEDDFFFNIR